MDEMRAAGIRLAYVAVPFRAADLTEAAANLGGRFVDCKITYIIDEESMRAPIAGTGVSAERYDGTQADSALVRLARQSGAYSRFRTDPAVAPSVCEQIYDAWLANSLNGSIADAVYVVRRDGTPVGMVTVGERNARGDIGLLAVDDSARRLGIGRALVARAHEWALAKGYRAMQVVTQRANEPACGLYERCGYRVETMVAVFHHWL